MGDVYDEDVMQRVVQRVLDTVRSCLHHTGGGEQEARLLVAMLHVAATDDALLQFALYVADEAQRAVQLLRNTELRAELLRQVRGRREALTRGAKLRAPGNRREGARRGWKRRAQTSTPSPSSSSSSSSASSSASSTSSSSSSSSSSFTTPEEDAEWGDVLDEYDAALEAQLQDVLGASATANERCLTLIQLSRTLRDSKDYRTEAIVLEKALVEAEKAYGQEHFRYAMVLTMLAIAINKVTERTKLTLPLLEESKDILERIGRTNELSYLDVLQRFGRALHAVGKLDQALAVHRKGRKLAKSLFGEQSEHYLDSCQCCVEVLQARPETAERALKISLKLLAARKKLNGEKSSVYEAQLNNTGTIYMDLRQFENAMPFFQESYRLFERRTAASIGTLSNLANCHLGLGNLEEAEKLFLSVLRQHEDLDLVETDNYGNALVLMSKTLRLLGRLDEALGYVARAKSILEKTSGTESVTFMTVLWNFTHIYMLQGKMNDALRTAWEGVSAVQRNRLPGVGMQQLFDHLLETTKPSDILRYQWFDFVNTKLFLKMPLQEPELQLLCAKGGVPQLQLARDRGMQLSRDCLKAAAKNEVADCRRVIYEWSNTAKLRDCEERKPLLKK